MPLPKLELHQSGPVAEATAGGAAGNRFRIAHLTDLHVGAVASSREGLAAALESLRWLDPLPDCLVLGGDMIEDGFASRDQNNRDDLPSLAEKQWLIFDEILQEGAPRKDGALIPIYPILGNHDIVGWGEPGLSITWNDAKAKAINHLSRVSPFLREGQTYYSVVHNGWRLIFLDSICGRGPDIWPGGSYYGGFDGGFPTGQQSAWLESQLANKAQNLAVFSHIPVLSSTPLFWNDYPYPGVPLDFFGNNYLRPNSFWPVQDATIMHFMKELVSQFAGAGVRLCASGHTHMLDWVTHRGVVFACSGAVCGNYWKGPCSDGSRPGYAIFDLWANGWLEMSYYSFGL